MNDDLTFSPVQYSTEERIKGNKTQGFRSIPLTPQAQEIITKTLKLNPDGDFLFMKDGQPIYADSFNEHLKNKSMQTIEYSLSFQSSDQIYDYNYALRSWRSTQSVIYHARTF